MLLHLQQECTRNTVGVGVEAGVSIGMGVELGVEVREELGV